MNATSYRALTSDIGKIANIDRCIKMKSNCKRVKLNHFFSYSKRPISTVAYK